MTARELEAVRALLRAALALPAAERSRFLDAQSSHSMDVRREVESLLSVHEEATGFLETPLAELAGASSPFVPIPAGTLLASRYRVEREIAESDFATVYMATDEQIGSKAVVIKVLDQMADPAAMHESFRSELRALSALHHPALVGISDVGLVRGEVPFLVLAYVPGVTLREIITAGPIDPERARRLVVLIAKALAAAHRLKIAHLDVKPENIMVSEPGSPEERVTLIDFGIALLPGLERGLGSAGSKIYMAPEQGMEPGPACDVYALGIVITELLGGKRGEIPAKVPDRPWRAIVKRCLETDPARRFASAEEVALALAWEPEKRRWPLWAGIAAAASVVVAGGIWLRPAGAPAPAAVPRAVPLVSTLESEIHPALSPDGKWLYFVRGLDGTGGLYRKAVDRGEPVQLLAGGPKRIRLRVSPDGEWLGFFVQHEHEFTFHRLDLMNPAEDVAIAKSEEIQSWSWAPDGQSVIIAHTLPSQRAQIFRVLTLATKKWRELALPKIPDSLYYNPVVSPDGKQLAYFLRSAAHSATRIHLVSIDDSLNPIEEPRPVGATQGRIDALEWASNGRELFFVGGRLGNASLWRLRIADGRVTAVPGLPTGLGLATVARNVPRVAVTVDLTDANIWNLDLERRSAAVLFASSQEDEAGVVSADGKSLVFTSARTGDLQVWLAEADGSNPRQVTHFAAADAVRAIWAGNSRTLLISMRKTGVGRMVYTAPAAVDAKLTLFLSDAIDPALSADGKRVYFCREAQAMRRLWVAGYPDPRDAHPVTQDEAYYGFEAPVGKSVYYAKQCGAGGLWQQTVPSGTPHSVIEPLHLRDLVAAGGRGLYYIARPSGATYPTLFFRPYGGGQGKALYSFTAEIGWGLTLGKDEKSLLYSQLDSGNFDILLVDGIP